MGWNPKKTIRELGKGQITKQLQTPMSGFKNNDTIEELTQKAGNTAVSSVASDGKASSVTNYPGGSGGAGGIQRPEYSGWVKPGGIAGQDMLAPGYSVTAGKTSFTAPKMSDMEAAQKMKNIGMGNEQSPWLKMQLEQNDLDKNRALQAMDRQNMGSQASARSQLAMRGGMNTGSRERLAQGGALAKMRGAQDIYGQMGQSNLTAQLQAGKDQQAMLGQAAGMESDLGKFGASGNFEADKFNTNLNYDASKTNVGNMMQDKTNKAGFDMQKYIEDQKVNSANIMANAMGKSGGSGGGMFSGFGKGMRLPFGIS